METLNIPQKYIRYFKLTSKYCYTNNLNNVTITYLCSYRKIYKYLIKILYFLISLFSFNRRLKIKMIFHKNFKIKLKEKLILIYSILNRKDIEKYMKEIAPIHLKFKIKDHVSFIYSNEIIYLSNKRNLNSQIHFYISDYLIGKNYHNENSQDITNSVFFSTINKIISKNKKYSFRLPQFFIRNYEETENFLNSLTLFAKRKSIGLNLNYTIDKKDNCSPEYNQIYEYFCTVIFKLMSIFERSELTLIFTILYVDECFPLHVLIDNLNLNLPQTRNGNFLINIRTVSIINHRLYPDVSSIESINMIGTSYFINKYFYRTKKLNKVHLFYFIIKKKLSRLENKFIKFTIAKFIVDYAFYTFDNIIELLEDESVKDCSVDFKNIIKYRQTVDETKSILLFKSYDPLA